MLTLVRTAALSLTTLVALAGLQACGSDDSDSSSASDTSSTSASSTDTASSDTTTPAAPSDTGSAATGSDLCNTFTSIPQGLSSDDPDAAVSAAHDFAGKLKDAGPPADMPADAQAGLSAYIDFIGGVSVDDVKQLESSNSSDPKAIFGDHADDVEAFFEYIAQNCAAALGGQPTP